MTSGQEISIQSRKVRLPGRKLLMACMAMALGGVPTGVIMPPRLAEKRDADEKGFGKVTAFT